MKSNAEAISGLGTWKPFFLCLDHAAPHGRMRPSAVSDSIPARHEKELGLELSGWALGYRFRRHSNAVMQSFSSEADGVSPRELALSLSQEVSNGPCTLLSTNYSRESLS